MSTSNSYVPLAQLAQEEVQEQVQGVNSHLYDADQGSIPAMGRDQLISMMANMQAQLLATQQQLQTYQQGLQQVQDHQHDVDQQAEDILASLNQQQPQQSQQIPLPPPVVLGILPAVHSIPPAVHPMQPAQKLVAVASSSRVDSAKPPAQFEGKRAEDIESWLISMQLYCAANNGLSDNQVAVRIALNLDVTAQKWFHNSIDVPLDHLTVQGMITEIIQAFNIPNKDQLARCQLSTLRQQGSVDGYSQAFRSTIYGCQDVSMPEARARFIEGLKPNTRLYVEERNPPRLDAAILLAQSFDTTRFGSQNQQFGNGRGQLVGRFGRGRGRYNPNYNNGQGYSQGQGSNNHQRGRGYQGGGRNSGRSGQNYPLAPTCFRCGQTGHMANHCQAHLPAKTQKN